MDTSCIVRLAATSQEISLTILKTRLWTIQAKSSTRNLVHIQNIQIQYHLEQGCLSSLMMLYVLISSKPD